MSVLDLFFTVFEPLSISYAIASGIALGATFILYLSLRFPVKVALSTTKFAAITAGSTLLIGSVFFAGQISQAFIMGDSQWPRIVARYALWDLFSIALGIGFGIAHSFAGRYEDRE